MSLQTPLKPRKTPRQARSTATVTAIFEATFQVLLSDGLVKLTTTRVAERAGVSVGTMYQYFPHKEALLYAVLEQYLYEVVIATEEACVRLEGARLGEMADGLVHAYLEAKLRHMPGSRVLYTVAAELDTDDLIDDIVRRADQAIERLLASASDAHFDDLPTVTFAVRTILVGTVREVLEKEAPASSLAMLRAQLPIMCRAYLMAVSSS
ncbi:TetR/AcrR family transcriptional regulator [Dyella sp. 333MFSha]|uniref:TetR/AcrR family transcriptional regulator n=1 Tax=Dyella sp. 333MFSha TaxID=1798240 RepID=UPI00088A609C|nr:TetR/AcrR family transcriptional regulator [Dyella sp. 333MFSha]SDG89400.1 DNA-binding transcriptional regulator, AcrR family [Dyella sp. 333MFSha]